MPTFVTRGDRQLLAGGSLSSLKRSSVPLSLFPSGSINAIGGATLSYQQIYETQPWAHTAVNKLTRQITRLPLKTYRLLDGTRADGERERVRDHPLPNLIRHPSPRRSAGWLKQKAVLPALKDGNALLGKVYASGAGSAPIGLEPLDWRFLTPLGDEGGEILGWKCAQPGRRAFYDPADVVHIAWDGGNGDIGVSPMKALGVTFTSEDATQRYQAASYGNGVRSSGAFVIPAEARTTKEQRDELREHLARTNGGVDNAGKPLLLFNGARFESTQQTAVEAELISQRELNREEIAAVYDIPPPLIGILDKATYSNIETQHKMLYTDVLGPWLTLIEEAIQSQLIDTYEPWAEERLFVEFDLAEVLKGDTLKEVQAIREAIATGIMTPNEGRQIRNLPPSDDPEADRLHMPTNNLSPMGTEDVTADDVTAPAKGLIRAEMKRVADRVAAKLGAGADPWDRDRFIREMTLALDGHTVDAGALADLAEDALEQGGTPAEVREALTALA